MGPLDKGKFAAEKTKVQKKPIKAWLAYMKNPNHASFYTKLALRKMTPLAFEASYTAKCVGGCGAFDIIGDSSMVLATLYGAKIQCQELPGDAYWISRAAKKCSVYTVPNFWWGAAQGLHIS